MSQESAALLKESKSRVFEKWQANDDLVDLLSWCDFVYEAYLLYQLLTEKQNKLKVALNIRETKLVIQKSSEKFLSQVQKSDEIFVEHLKQLEDIKTKLVNVLALSTSSHADEDLGQIYHIQEELSK